MSPSAIPDVLFLRPTPVGSREPAAGPSSFQTASDSAPQAATAHGRSVHEKVRQLQSSPRTAADAIGARTSVASLAGRQLASAPASQWYADFPVAPTVVRPHVWTPGSESDSAGKFHSHPARLEPQDANSASPTRPQWPCVSRALLKSESRLWRALIEHMAGEPVIGIMGLSPHVGTSTMAVALAQASCELGGDHDHMQMDSQKPLRLVDANLRRPSLATLFGGQPLGGWNEWEPDSHFEARPISGPSGLEIMPLTCGILPRDTDRSGLQESESANSVRYYLPEHATAPLLRKLHSIVGRYSQHAARQIIDLGTVSFWSNQGLLPSLATVCSQILLVIPSGANSRAVSRAYWQLTDAQMGKVAILENSRPN